MAINAEVVYSELKSKDSTTAKHLLQRTLASMLLKVRSFNVDCDERLRHKMKRWRLNIPHGIVCRRISRRLKLVQELTSPRVQGGVFRTLWNGWTTAARFQGTHRCVLACSPTAEDRIEHYACCPFFRRLIINWMGLDPRLVSLAGFLLAAPVMSDQEVVLVSVAVYAMHRATAHFRNGGAPAPQVVTDFLQQMCQSAVFGHSSLMVLEQATRHRHAINRH